MKLWDTHAHIYMLQNPDAAVLGFADHGIAGCVCPGVDDATSRAAIEYATRYPSSVFASIGVHPSYPECEDWDALAALAANPQVVAIGETGLDYYRPHDRSLQIKRFIRHIELAEQHQLPLIVHTRCAAEDTLAILKEGVGSVPVVLHSFTESTAVAEQALDRGYYLSCSGIATFKNAQSLRDVFKHVPAQQLLIETDSPYLAPEPYRGRENEPKYLHAIAERLAELRHCSLDELATQLSANTHSVFFPHA